MDQKGWNRMQKVVEGVEIQKSHTRLFPLTFYCGGLFGIAENEYDESFIVRLASTGAEGGWKELEFEILSLACIAWNFVLKGSWRLWKRRRKFKIENKGIFIPRNVIVRDFRAKIRVS